MKSFAKYSLHIGISSKEYNWVEAQILSQNLNNVG